MTDSFDDSTCGVDGGDWWVVVFDSIYRIDPAKHQIERVTGMSPPTPRLVADGRRRSYERLHGDQSLGAGIIDVPVVGQELIIGWGGDEKFTRVTNVVTITRRPAWGRSYWIADPETVQGGAGAVIAAGQPAFVTPRPDAAFVLAALLTIGSAESPTGTAIGLASITTGNFPRTWSTFDTEPAFAEPRDDGWRRPWDVPPSFAIEPDVDPNQ